MYQCPVCNGLTEPERRCPICEEHLTDKGPVSDYYGPYSPYRPIDDMQLAVQTINPDQEYDRHSCQHYYQCSQCGHLLSANVEKLWL